MKKITACVLLMLIVSTAYAAPKKPKIVKGQKQPDAQRVVEIQTALKDHGYEPGKNWSETKEACRKIADDHGWQNMWAPDARVLIMLGLNPKADPDVATQPGNKLDEVERIWVEQNGPGKIK